MEEQEIGQISHYYNKIGVAIVKLSNPLRVGEEVHVKGATTDFSQTVESMQAEHENVEEAQPGEIIGLKVKEPVREADKVYKASA